MSDIWENQLLFNITCCKIVYMGNGKVYLIGAGPGDPGLLTIKAKDAIAKCDIILYDCLVSEEIIETLPDNKNLLCVGKMGASHIMEQDEINSLIYNLASDGQIIARLKGGDPFLFGRGGEEALYLMEKGIDVEIISGISSSLACPLYAGISITHRDYASSLTIITGHRKDDDKISWKELAKGQGTLIILMGIERITEITKALIEAGKDPKTPTSVIRWGSLPYQQTITGELQEIGRLVSENNITPPGVIVIGDVVKLREKMAWFEKKPLFGKKILVLRPEGQIDNLSKILFDKGAEVIKFPIISIVPYNDPALPYILEKINSYDWLVFTSTNGVRLFFEKLDDIRGFYGPKIAAIGEKTRDEIARLKIKVDIMPETYQQEALLDMLLKEGIKDKKVLVIRSKEGRDILISGISRNGASVNTLILYEAKPTEKDPNPIKSIIQNNEIDAICFTSPSCVSSFLKLIGIFDAKIASIGPITSKALMDNGISVDIVASTFTDEGLVDAICGYYKNEHKRTI
ncbi:MAG: uroporphyrinogen-III C-methyltransferase [bacterium]